MKIKILDCTLRDGGYINDWNFGEKNIAYILRKLAETKVDLIECGYVSDNRGEKAGSSYYSKISEAESYIRQAAGEKSEYACMINFGECEADSLPDYEGGAVSTLRLAFHKKDMDPALAYAEKLKRKGYKVFIQPMVTNGYHDSELLSLIKKVNRLEPAAFYIVDSFGVMRQNELIHYLHMVDKNLSKKIRLGYHAHNNLQMAYSNAQTIVNSHLKRDLIIDTSSFGMGRGAGNLNTELFMDYLNRTLETKYRIRPLLQIIDHVLNPIYEEHKWGYALPYFLSATYHCHPNYATYLTNKNILSVASMEEILRSIPEEKRNSFDRSAVAALYAAHQSQKSKGKNGRIREILDVEEVAVLGPGVSIKEREEEIKDFLKSRDILTVSINFIPAFMDPDYVFINNEKRLEQILSWSRDGREIPWIVSGNLKTGGKEAVTVDYRELLNEKEPVQDNGALMFLTLLVRNGVKRAYLAGIDGYSHDAARNYAAEELKNAYSHDFIEMHNKSVSEVLTELSGKIQINFITPTRYRLQGE